MVVPDPRRRTVRARTTVAGISRHPSALRPVLRGDGPAPGGRDHGHARLVRRAAPSAPAARAALAATTREGERRAVRRDAGVRDARRARLCPGAARHLSRTFRSGHRFATSVAGGRDVVPVALAEKYFPVCEKRLTTFRRRSR